MRTLLPILAACLLGVAAPATACTGDLDGDGRVTVGELVRCVGGLLGTAPDPACRAAYPVLVIHALIRGVNNALAGCPATRTPTITATLTPSSTPTPTFTWAPTPTPTSCVSEPPYIRSALPDATQPFLWHVSGRSRILLNGRGHMSASLNCQGAIAVRADGYQSQEYEVDVELAHPGGNLVSVCTAPAMCGTAWCRQRRIDCGESACVDRGDLPPVLRRDLTCTGVP